MACKARYGLKIGYATKEIALESAKKSSRKRDIELRAYECPECKLWHLTSKPYKPKIRTVKCGACDKIFKTEKPHKKYCDSGCKSYAQYLRKQEKNDKL